MIFLLFLGYHKTGEFYTSAPLVLLKEFGVVQNGYFEVDFETQGHDVQIFVGLCSDIEMKTVWDPEFDYTTVCSSDDRFIANHNQTVTVVKDKTYRIYPQENVVVHPVFIPCTRENHQIRYSALFENDKSFLDSRKKWILLALPIEFGGLLIVLLGLTISLCAKRGIYLKFHGYLISAIAVEMVMIVFSEMDLFLSSESPEESNIYMVAFGFSILSQMMICTTLVLCGSGWAIHTSHFPLVSFIVTAIAAGLLHAIELLTIHKMYVVVYIVQMFCCLVITKMIINELRICERYLLSYQLVVDAVGIDSNTTPVETRNIMQYVCLLTCAIYMSAKVIWVNANMYFDVAPLVENIVSRALNVLLFLVLAANYLPVKVDRADWEQTYDDDSFFNSAIEEFNQEAFATDKKKVEWKPGMRLPLPPMVAKLDFSLPLEPENNENEEPLIDSMTI